MGGERKLKECYPCLENILIDNETSLIIDRLWKLEQCRQLCQCWLERPSNKNIYLIKMNNVYSRLKELIIFNNKSKRIDKHNLVPYSFLFTFSFFLSCVFVYKKISAGRKYPPYHFILVPKCPRYHFVLGPKCLGTQKSGTELSGT